MLERQLDLFSAQTIQGYTDEGAETAPSAPEDVFATVACQLQLAHVSLAAGEILEGADADRLDVALDGLSATGAAVQDEVNAVAGVIQGYESRGMTSPDADSAVRTLLHECDATINAITQQTVKGVSKPIIAVRNTALIKQSLDWLGKNLPDGLLQALNTNAKRFVRIALRCVTSALDWLHRFVPLAAISWARDAIQRLLDRLSDEEAPEAVVGWVIDVDGCRQAVRDLLAGPGLDVTALDNATDEVRRLAGKYERLMNLAGLTAVGIGTLGGVAHWFGPAAPQLLIAVGVADMLLIAAVLLAAMDHLDTGNFTRFVTGVQGLVTKAAR